MKLANEPSWWALTFDPVHSIFEPCGVMANEPVAPGAAGAAAAAVEGAVGAGAVSVDPPHAAKTVAEKVRARAASVEE